MDILHMVRGWVGGAVAVLLTLIPFMLVIQILFGNTPGIGNVVGNLMGLIDQVASKGLFGLIAIFIIIWLFRFLNMRSS